MTSSTIAQPEKRVPAHVQYGMSSTSAAISEDLGPDSRVTSGDTKYSWDIQSKFPQWQAHLTGIVCPDIHMTQTAVTCSNVIIIHSGSEASKAFSNLDLIRSDDSQIRKVIAQIRGSNEISFNEKIANRIEYLLDAYKEDFDNRVFSLDSLRNFVDFLGATPRLKYPTLTITPGGDLYASWKHGSEFLFSVQFLSTNKVRYVVFRPNQNHIGQNDQYSGLTSSDLLMKMVSVFDVLEWASE